MALQLFGLDVAHPVVVASMSHVDSVQLLNQQKQRLSNNAEYWIWQDVLLRPVLQDDARAHAVMAQLLQNPRRVYEADALQIYNTASGSALPQATATEALNGGQLSVDISFPANLTQAQVDGLARRFFTFSGHRKLYCVNTLGVAVGARAGNLKFIPNLQADVESGETLNFASPKAQMALMDGEPAKTMTTPNGFWEISLNLEEAWLS